eukprot:Protomagalhaensia_sp_Gyna_25__5207@NODE_627_length_2969_cov_16_655973_g486_i0_p1_GENE_NODE_627_length_2969_cov_16_655973_g486_i0NODE_627_length_2969_cov_16_655973_g486_i0_p1_ORF_typecomplete_len407_score73_04Gar1/PF04410_14/2_5e11_NODE_627_length_2969_cov_16_655973_g486_i016832903
MRIAPEDYGQPPPPPPSGPVWPPMVAGLPPNAIAGGALIPVQTPQGVVMAQIPPNFMPIQTSAGMILAPVVQPALQPSQLQPQQMNMPLQPQHRFPQPSQLQHHPVIPLPQPMQLPQLPAPYRPSPKQPSPREQPRKRPNRSRRSMVVRPPLPRSPPSPAISATVVPPKTVSSSSSQQMVEEYHVDGETRFDDIVFASLFAKMDNEVLEHLKELAQTAPQQRQLAAADDDESVSSIDEEEIKNLDDFLNELKAKIACHDKDAEDAGGDEDKNLISLPEGVDATRIGDIVSGDIKPLGTVLHDMQSLINVKACYAPNVYDVGSICCNGQRKVIGVVVDTIGPVIAPFYIIRRLKDVAIEPDETIFVDTAKSSVAEIAVDVEDEGDGDDYVDEAEGRITCTPEGNQNS